MSKDLFPVLNEDISIHFQPDNVLVINQKTSVIEWVNIIGGEILQLCDGSHSISEICKILADTYKEELSRAISLIHPFLKESQEKGYIENLPYASFHKLNITGSKNYYAPMNASIELTQKCQLDCKHCYVDAGNVKEDFPSIKIIKLFYDLRKLGVVNLNLTGGEPLLHPDFFNILEIACDQFAFVEVLSNGYLIDEEIAKRLSLYKNKMVVQISLDGMESFHNAFRGKSDSFQKAVSAISFLSAHDIFVTVGMSVEHENIDQIKDVATISKNKGAKKFEIGSILSSGRAKNKGYRLSKEQMSKIEEILNDLLKLEEDDFYIKRSHSLEMEITDEKLKEHQKNCGSGYLVCHISVNGDVLPCPLLPYSLGNIFTQSYEEIFGNPRVKFLVNLQTPNISICGECPSLYQCDGCHAAAWVEKDNNPNCPWMKQWSKLLP